MPHEPQIGTVEALASRARLTRNPDGLARITFLIGAGCSVSAGIPAVTAIAQDEVKRLARKLTSKTQADPAKALLQAAKHGYLTGHREIAENSPDQLDWGAIYDTLFAEVHTAPSDVARVFKSIIKEAKPKVNWAHLALGELARLNWISTTITTNFDLLALEGYARAGVIPVVSDGLESLDRIDPLPDQPQILQINGSVHSYRMRNSSADLDQVRSSSSAITCFRNLFQASDLLVVVGYEGREPQIMDLLIDAAKTFRDKHIFWCLYSSNPARLSPRAAEFLSYSNNARLIPGQDADLFFHNLSSELGIGAPLAFRDPLAFMEERLTKVYAADRPEQAAIRSDILALQDRITRLRASENAPPSQEPTQKPAKGRRRATPVAAEAQPPEQTASAADATNARFDALDKAYDEALASGRDKGIAKDLETAISLAQEQLELALTSDQRGAALNNLGRALQTLGVRETGKRLDQAVTAYREALKERARDRVPLEWAGTQNNLGSALLDLGRRETGTARADQAVAAYEEALKEWTRDRVPLDWAMTQNNLGNALLTLGERELDTARLDQAVAAYQEALKERTRDRVPLNWAATQNNLGIALSTLGERKSDTARLNQAVAAFQEALKEYTQDRVPLDWAMTQNNLGAALKALGRHETGTARLNEAVAAYQEALKERTRDRVPLDWAATMANLGSVEITFFDKTGDPAHLVTARTHLMAAREVFLQAGATHYLATVDGNLALIASREA